LTHGSGSHTAERTRRRAGERAHGNHD
jgi:hypothetical protein